MESLESYQIKSSLTDHSLAFRIPPPASNTTFLGALLRDLATFQPALTIATHWHQPPASRPHRPNDRPIWPHLTPALGTTLISINRSHANKVRWVGDNTNEKGTMLLSLPSFHPSTPNMAGPAQRSNALPPSGMPSPQLHHTTHPLYSGNRPYSGVLNSSASRCPPLCRLYHGPISPTWTNA
ncbi:hypothetical protein DYB36_007995 [Aphanomyces astaci]|uniref:Uncharacterized protein n=1 Tax=Aphanomyces astaci TaxID=112090 RepID=A0A397BGP2_APHAT|nr:hypothetical protein DYB36_007995 [Aphanomyces astaci]